MRASKSTASTVAAAAYLRALAGPLARQIWMFLNSGQH
jgi:hypothetical protein